MRRILPLISLVLLCAVPNGIARAAADTPELSLASILTGADGRHAGPPSINEGPAAVLASLAGAETFPVGCATPILIAAARETTPSDTLRQAGTLLATPPLPADARVFVTRDGRFALRYAAAGTVWHDGEVTSETVARMAEALVAARSYLTGTLGYADPAPGDARVAVYLVHLGHGLEGYVVPPRAGGRAAPPFVVLDAALASDRIMPAILHQAAHLALLRSVESAAWWQEATASFLTLLGAGDLETQRTAIRSRQQSTSRGLEDDGLLHMQGTLLWPLFLAERTGDPDVVRRIWVAMDGGTPDPLQATDVVLARDEGLTTRAALREMAIWSLFTGERDDGAHFSAARTMPAASMDTVGPALPIQIGPVEPVEPLGSLAFRLPAERASGSIGLEVHARGGLPAADLLVFYQSEGGRPVLVPVDLSEGSARVSLPWGQAREAWIVLRNDARPADGSGASSFDLRASLDASAPFDLASFTADALGHSVVLSWTTATEKGLIGWNVYRSEASAGPFSRLNGVALPAYGDADADTGYVFVDDAARPDRRYYYLVEGITANGLAERSHLTSARTLPAR